MNNAQSGGLTAAEIDAIVQVRIELLRNADGNGLAYASTNVAVVHPELSPSSVFAGMDTPDRVTVLVVNKTSAPRTFGLRLTNADKLGRPSARSTPATPRRISPGKTC